MVDVVRLMVDGGWLMMERLEMLQDVKDHKSASIKQMMMNFVF